MSDESDFSLEGFTEDEIAKLKREASKNWSGATVAYFRFRQLVKEFKMRKKDNGT
jgi:hypothetical protein